MADTSMFLGVHPLPESYLPFVRQYGLDALVEKHEYYHYQLNNGADALGVLQIDEIEFVVHSYGLINMNGLVQKHLSLSADYRFAILLLREVQKGEPTPNEVVIIAQQIPELSCYVATLIHYTHGRQLTYPTPLD